MGKPPEPHCLKYYTILALSVFKKMCFEFEEVKKESNVNTKVFCPHCEACRAIALRFLLLIESFHPCCLPSCSTCLLDSLRMGCKTRIMFLWLYFFHEHLRICDPYTIAFRVFQCNGLFLKI